MNNDLMIWPNALSVLWTRAKSPARRSMRSAKATKWKPASVSGRRSWSRASRRQRAVPGEGTLDHPPAGQQDEPPLRRGRCDHLQDDAVRLGGLGRPLTGVALVDVGQRDVLAGGVLDGLGQLGHRRAGVLGGGGDAAREQVAERVHSQVQLGAARALVAVPSCARAAL